MTSPPPGALASGYGVRAPTEADARAALQRVFGPERGAERWTDACRAAGLSVGRVAPGAPLERAVAALAEQSGAAASVARSIEIRARTYARLTARAGLAGGAPQ